MSLSKACYDQLKPFVDRAQGDPDDACIVACMDGIMRVCFEHGMAYEATVHSKQVGIHPKNRDGEGFILGRAISRGVKVTQCGFSWRVVKMDAVAVEDHPLHRHIAKSTKLQSDLNPGAAQYVESEVRLGPLGATHINHWIAMVHDESPCNEPTISENGKMSKRKCCADPGTKEAERVGLVWKVLRHQVEQAFGSIPIIIQRALNLTAQMAEGDS